MKKEIRFPPQDQTTVYASHCVVVTMADHFLVTFYQVNPTHRLGEKVVDARAVASLVIAPGSLRGIGKMIIEEYSKWMLEQGEPDTTETLGMDESTATEDVAA